MSFHLCAGTGPGLLLRLFLVFATVSVVVDGMNLWPMPKSVNYGSQTLYLSKDFKLRTEGSYYADGLGILQDGFSRMVDIVVASRAIGPNVTNSHVLAGIVVEISSSDDTLNFGIDESYKLFIPSTGYPLFGRIEAKTVYGALHGFQTFSQLCHFNFTTRNIELHLAPWIIDDQPRHYQTLTVMKNVIDAMAYTKLNVLHWHIVDTQSFPLEIPSYPKLWNGAYSYSERYTMAEAAEIVLYAQKRGINVLAEIDVPGHAFSWGIGYPSLWPSSDCQQPLDVSNEFTFKVIDGILSDFSKVFKFKFVHLGGDEVDTRCWMTTPHVKKWLDKHGMNESKAYEYFVLRAQNIALSHGYEIVNWEETFNNFGNMLSPKTVVHNWLDVGVAPRVVAAGLRCIVSDQNNWYLDHLSTTWQQFYMNEPLTNITNHEHQKLVIGGEVCMWGETVDGSDIEQTIWPRAAAAAALWTPFDKLAREPRQVTSRLAHFRCLLNQRGVAAGPITGGGRAAPEEPGSCYKQ
ncbi:unnamed protein product [Spirodela intermedia]|uniref:Beta-hexosaminidase n=1 Tax=Spirodela intermedia TaxID=51605 RepID=A0A7I8JC42_SPIIN|nr:unnamed protein product [Spirodela intermedia]CAA6667758.1 unnamed protein product [Spirodela intermedia]